MPSTTIDVPGVRELPDTEASALFDRQARELTGLTGTEFVQRWRTGAFADSEDDAIMHMVLLLPLVVNVPPTAPQGDDAAHLSGGFGMRVGCYFDRAIDWLRSEATRGWQARTHTKP